MALFSKRNIKSSDHLYAYFEALENKGLWVFEIDDPVNREYISKVIDIIESFENSKVIFQWYQSSSEIYFLEEQLMDNRIKIDSYYIHKDKSYYDFWTDVHRTLIMTYLANRENYLDKISVV